MFEHAVRLKSFEDVNITPVAFQKTNFLHCAEY